MTDVVWLASYPKSGNTWLRMLIAALSPVGERGIDINAMPADQTIASARDIFDDRLLIGSDLLTHDEIDCLRPRLYEDLAGDSAATGPSQANLGVRFVKAHDAYTLTPLGEPLFAGARAAQGAIVIVRDPRDVVPSLANHNLSTIDAAVEFLNSTQSAFSDGTAGLPPQLRQKLLDWSGHVASWLDQTDMPVHVLRYEDLMRDTAGCLMSAMRFAHRPIEQHRAERAVALASFEKLQAQEAEMGFAEWNARQAKQTRFFRRGKMGSWREELTREQVRKVERAHGAMMSRMGYELSTDVAVAE